MKKNKFKQVLTLGVLLSPFALGVPVFAEDSSTTVNTPDTELTANQSKDTGSSQALTVEKSTQSDKETTVLKKEEQKTAPIEEKKEESKPAEIPAPQPIPEKLPEAGFEGLGIAGLVGAAAGLGATTLAKKRAKNKTE